MTNVLDVLAKHIPFLSEDNEAEIWTVIGDLFVFGTPRDREADVADLAQRTCMCGAHIDGFDAYTDHLRTKIEESIS